MKRFRVSKVTEDAESSSKDTSTVEVSLVPVTPFRLLEVLGVGKVGAGGQCLKNKQLDKTNCKHRGYGHLPVRVPR